MRTDEDLLAPVCDEDPTPYLRVKPGMYELRCVGQKLERVRMFGNAWKYRLKFAFMDLETKGHLVKFFHLGTKDKPHAGRKSEYWAAWLLANRGQLPRRGQTMTARAFLDKIFLCEVDFVTTRFDGTEHSDEAAYSVVKRLLELRGP